MDIYGRIKSLRTEKGYSQQKLAELVGYKDKTAIAHVESGKIDLPQSKILAIADALGTTTSFLIEGYEEEEEKQINQDARKFYLKYLSADKKTRKMIDLLLEEGE